MTGVTTCISCKEPIKNGANRCIHCNCYQNWRRFFDFSGIVLSLLVALISVLTVSIPIIKATFESNTSDVTFVFLEFKSNTKIRVASINRGNRDAVLKSASLLVLRDKKKDPPEQLSFDAADPLIGPQKIEFFDLYIKGEDGSPKGLPLGGLSVDNCRYQIDFNLVAFDHNLAKKAPIEFSCP